MRMRTIVAVSVCGLVGGSAMLAAPEQTQRPGQMTEAHVWVQNRGRGEAVPVDVNSVNTDTPLRVHVLNGEPTPGTPINPLQVRVLRPQWDYKTITVKTGSDPTPALNSNGVDGWETTGIVTDGADGTRYLLKRQR